MIVQETERQLIGAIQAGDEEALRRLYERFSNYTLAVVRRYVPERADALDIVQDGFVSILTRIGSFEYRGEGSLKAWVTRIVTNRALDWLRAHEQLTFTDQMPDETEENEDDAAVEEVPPDILNTMIGRLPTKYRVIVNLFAFEQLSHKDIAQRLGITERTSVSQFSRAKRRLAEMIKEYLNSQRI